MHQSEMEENMVPFYWYYFLGARESALDNESAGEVQWVIGPGVGSSVGAR